MSLTTPLHPSETRAEVAARLKTRAFYHPTLTSIDPDARAILESYAGIPSDQVLSHVQTIRDEAWEMFPYPCMGMFSFVKMHISKNPAYPGVLKRLFDQDEHSDAKATLLDLGCGFGQELRTLIAAGVPTRNLYGLDVSDGFIELGFQLFRDKASMASQFVVADLLASGVPANLVRKFDIIFVASFFHLFGWDDQLTLSKRAVAMLKPEAGSMIFGHQLGEVEARESVVPDVPSGKIYFHDPDSFRRLWRVLSEETGTKWRVEIDSTERWIDDMRKTRPDLRLLRFEVERL